MFATGPRRPKGLEFVCILGHDGHVRNNSGFIYLARRVQKHKRVAQPLMVVLSTIMIDELGDGPSRGS